MTDALPVIVGFGGFNAAGRSSSHQAFRRMILESLPEEQQRQTIVSLACLMGLVTAGSEGYTDSGGNILDAALVADNYKKAVIDGTLVRKIEHFDADNLSSHRKTDFLDHQAVFVMLKRDVPKQLPDGWAIRELSDGKVEVTTAGNAEFWISSHYELAAKAAGQLPRGFNPSEHYNSRFHPRGLQMALLGVSDAIHSMGIPWDSVVDKVRPDQIGVYSSSVFGQIDEEGMAGLFQARFKRRADYSKTGSSRFKFYAGRFC